MNDSGQMMPYQELWERLKQVTGERNRLEAELAALEANPPLEAPVLAEVEAHALKEVCVDRHPRYRIQRWEISWPAQYTDPAQLDVTVTIRGR